jgi:hypothetical protein
MAMAVGVKGLDRMLAKSARFASNTMVESLFGHRHFKSENANIRRRRCLSPSAEWVFPVLGLKFIDLDHPSRDDACGQENGELSQIAALLMV